MISNTSPDSLAAPTSLSPLDTMVTLLASHSGLLISSAIWWKTDVTKCQNLNQHYTLLYAAEMDSTLITCI